MIRLKDGYRGRPSQERFIPPGDYPENDEALLGLTQYLVTNGHAEVIGGGSLGDEPETPTPTDPLDSMSKADLLDLATKRGLAANARMTKEVLLALLRGQTPALDEPSGQTPAPSGESEKNDGNGS